jgi:prepilin-type N-terminal cleavage/methylation domain-containing protein
MLYMASKKSGFSIIELLVVISIILLFTAMALAIISRARMRSRDTARIANAKQISLALETYQIDSGSYLLSGAGYNNTGEGYVAKRDTPEYSTSILSLLESKGYVNRDTLVDPIFPDNYYLGVCDNNDNYTLYVHMEQEELQQPEETLQAGCDGATAIALDFNYISGIGSPKQLAGTQQAGESGPVHATTTIDIGGTGSVASTGVLATLTNISLSTANTASVGNGTISAPLNTPPAAIGDGSHTIQRSDNTYLTLNGAGTASTLYNPTTDLFSAGPTAPITLDASAHTIQKQDGNFITFASVTNGNFSYNQTTNAFGGGYGLPGNSPRYGSHSLILGNGKILIPILHTYYGTYLYTLSTDTFASGPGVTSNMSGEGGHSIRRPDGTFLMYLGNNILTNIYNPGGNTFSAGPNALGQLSYGGHSIQRPNGTFLTVRGNATETLIYNPSTNTITGGPSLNCIARHGSHSIARADGTYLIFCGNGVGTTNIYDPVANTMTNGPSFPIAISWGAHSFQRPDGKYVVFGGTGTTNTRIYDAGWNMTGTYTSEDILVPELNASSTLQYTKSGTGVALVEIKTAASQAALGTATYKTILPNGSIESDPGSTWVKIRVTLNRELPAIAQTPNVWLGDECTRYIPTLTTPTVSNIRIVQ